MKHLCFAVIRDWPACTTLQFIEPYLEALRDIRLAMNESEVYENVAVFDDPCRIQDGRRNLDDFKRALTELVLHEWAESEADEGRNALGTGDSFA